MGIMGDLGSSLTGKVESACILIEDLRGKAVPQPGGGAGASALNAVTSSALTSGISSVVGQVMDTRKRFTVQFNPSELQIYASSLPQNKEDAQKKNGKSKTFSDAALKPTVELTVNLIFDDVNIYDSFMWDKYTAALRGNPTAIAKSAASIAMAATGKVWTVQTEVEGFVSALRNIYTRSITFQWAQFSFTGMLNNVNARYTMFSTTGRPVRANVMLRLKQELDPKALQSWYDDFDSAFSGDGSNLVLSTGKGGNLLNMNIF